MAVPATTRQISYLKSLVAATGEDYRDFLKANGYSAQPCKSEASRLIDNLKHGSKSVGHAPDLDLMLGY